jgi:hypothetical protein
VLNKIQKIINNIKKIDKKRTINLAIFLTLLITLPIILSSPEEKLNTKQYAQIVPQGVLPIYGNLASNLDTLKTGWTAKITFGATTGSYDLVNQTHFSCGEHSLAWTISAPFQQLELTSPTTFDISSYTYLTLYAEAGSPGQSIGAVIIDSNGNSIPDANSSQIPISLYGGAPVVGSWTEYNIPITSFNLTNKTIKGIALKELNGGTQNIQPPPPIYFDEINFSTQKGSNIPCPTGATQPTQIPIPTQGIQMPYYPEIDPLIFIIPGIVILLAMIF